MYGVIGVIALLTVLSLSLFVTRLATVALVFTGLSWDVARFQARSAFTGTGYTTSEAENLVNHPVRRRILMTLMLLRSAGLVTIVLSLILSFTGGSVETHVMRLSWLAGGIVLLWLLSLSRWVDWLVQKMTRHALSYWTQLDVHDYISLLNVSGDYVVQEMHVHEHDWLSGQELNECKLRKEGILVIGIYRSDGRYLGAPDGKTEIREGDCLVLYGRKQDLGELDKRRKGDSGDQNHEQAVREQDIRKDNQKREDAKHTPNAEI
jgi:NhaP-type Na+/H+ and K+/H+ antiporter